MTDQRQPQGEQEFAEEKASLFRITFGPLVWTVHFLASYAATAVYCAKLWPTTLGFDLLTWGIGVATVLALGAIGWAGWSSWRQWRDENEDWDDADGSNEDRTQFLGHAAFLLTIISFIGVIYTALPALLSASCL